MLRAIAVPWQRMDGDVRVIKVTGAPRVSYWELQTLNGNSLGFSPSNTLGVLTFATSFSGAARLIPATLRGTVYRTGISVSAVTTGPPSASYTVTTPAILSGPVLFDSDPFTVDSIDITTPINVTLSSSLSGTFSQNSITLPIGSATQTFTYAPTVVGTHVISFSSSLANPNPIDYIATAQGGGGGGN